MHQASYLRQCRKGLLCWNLSRVAPELKLEALVARSTCREPLLRYSVCNSREALWASLLRSQSTMKLLKRFVHFNHSASDVIGIGGAGVEKKKSRDIPCSILSRESSFSSGSPM